MFPEELADETNRRQMEYSTQFFGYTPDSLVDTVVGDVSDAVAANLKAAKKHSLAQFEGTASEQEVEEAFRRLTERYTEQVERIYFKFGAYVKDKILNVPAVKWGRNIYTNVRKFLQF